MLKRIYKLAIDSLPWRRKYVFTGEWDKTQLALSSSKFLCFSLIKVCKAKTVFALTLWDRVTTPNAQLWETEDRNLFSELVCGPGFSRPNPESIREEGLTTRLLVEQENLSRPTGCLRSRSASQICASILKQRDRSGLKRSIKFERQPSQRGFMMRSEAQTASQPG